jgi:hypothetical protein
VGGLELIPVLLPGGIVGGTLGGTKSVVGGDILLISVLEPVSFFFGSVGGLAGVGNVGGMVGVTGFSPGVIITRSPRQPSGKKYLLETKNKLLLFQFNNH